MYLFAPVLAGIWKQRELWDGTYDAGDLLDAHRLLELRDRALRER